MCKSSVYFSAPHFQLRPGATGGHTGAVPPQLTACAPPTDCLCPPKRGLCPEEINRLGAKLVFLWTYTGFWDEDLFFLGD